MDTVTVRFENVGPSHKTWSAELPSPLTAHSLIRSIKKQNALGSRDIDFSEESEMGGGIYVGMFRKVGTWRILPATEAPHVES